MAEAFQSDPNSFHSLCSNDLNNIEIDMKETIHMTIACGSILLSKSDLNIFFSCFSCEMELDDIEEFLEHSLLHHMGLKETDLAVILSKMRKKREKLVSTCKTDVSDGSSMKVDFEDDVSQDYCRNVVNNVNETKNFIGKFENFISHSSSDEIADLPSNERLANSGSISAADSDIIEDTVVTAEEKTGNFELIIIKPNQFGSDSNAVKTKTSRSTVLTQNVPNKKKIFKCNICDRTYDVRYNFVLHMRRHHDVKPYVCEFCDARFPDTSNWKVHRQRHLGIKPHKCTICEKSFTSTTDLKTHMITHTGERRFPCLDCGKLCRTATLLNYHRRRHSDDRQYVCVTCGKRFYEMQLLRDHEVSHSSDRPFECEICKMTFSRKKVLRQHAKLHFAVKKYACKLCSKTFAQYAGLHSHMKTHLPEKSDKMKKKGQNDL